MRETVTLEYPKTNIITAYSIAFGVKVDSLTRKKTDFAESFDAIQLYNFHCFIFPINAPIVKIKEKMSGSNRKTIAQHLDTVDRFAYKIIKERRSCIEEHGGDDESVINKKTDLLYRFMKAKNADGELYSDKELRDSMLNFIVAGRDTSAQTLSWLFYNIMMYPRIEEKLLDEIEKYITEDIENDTVALYEATKKMIYSHAV